jgi:DNA-binding CsgD family transcriptional regulator
VRFAQGDFDSTKSFPAQSFSILGVHGDPLDTALALALMLHGAVLSSEGLYEEAEKPLREALALADHLHDHVLRVGVAGRALANLAGVAVGRQDFTSASVHGEGALRLFHSMQLDLAESLLLMDLGSIALIAGDDELAAERWGQGIASIGDWGDIGITADLLAGIACVATARGAWREALLLFGAAEAEREREGAKLPWPPAVTVIDRSLATLRSGLDDASVSRMLAEGRALARSEAVNVASGIVQPTRAMPDAHASDLLTRREMDVLYLLAEQWTDQEIADRLFLSRRTVSWHVRSILAKLDTTTRGEAIAKARGRGLL